MHLTRRAQTVWDVMLDGHYRPKPKIARLSGESEEYVARYLLRFNKLINYRVLRVRAIYGAYVYALRHWENP